MNIYSFGSLIRVIAFFEDIVKFTPSRPSLLLYFPLECMEKFKPIADFLSTELERMSVDDDMKINVVERLINFFFLYKGKTNIGMHLEDQVRLAEYIMQFLQ